MNHREVMQQALEGIQSVMEMAFHERYAECCGRGQGGECCGSPVEAWPEWAQKVMDGLADSQRALSAELAKPDNQGIRDLEEAEQYIQQSIDNAPEPLKRLGEWLTNVLDENQWPHAERLLLGAIAAKPAAVPTDEAIVAAFKAAGMNTDIDQMPNMLYSVRGQLAQLINGARALLADQQPAVVPDGWVMVPRETTWQMNAAGSNAGGLGYRDVENINDDVAEDVYKAMLAAAPQPPAPAVSPVDVEAVRGGSSMWTAQEAARMLANRPNQPHYIEAIINKCISAAMNRERGG